MRNLGASHGHAIREDDSSTGRQLPHGHGVAERQQPFAEHAGEPGEELDRPRRSDDLEAARPRREIAVAPRVEKRREVDDVVGVEVRDGQVRDVLPADREIGQP
jgi:hypothetical protein